MASEGEPFGERINVTKTFMPPIAEYQKYLYRIWASKYLTNQGPLLREFESAIHDYLGIQQLHFVSNGTMALQIALRSLGITEGEIITTPFSYVATTSAILWEQCRPIYVDIEPETFCMDPAKIEAAITPQTKAIMPVHVFGYPCDVEAIGEIAARHNLPVIYDGAHAFGAQYKGRSLLDYGDVSTCSFHATKLFHTIEGGCIFVKDPGVDARIELAKHFGHEGDTHYQLGINAKATEFQAAMGLCNIGYTEDVIRARKKRYDLYDELLQGLRRPQLNPETKHNYGYYPLLLSSEQQLLRLVQKLKMLNIHPRRYFYPALNTLPYVGAKQPCPVAEDIAVRILCLPLYADLQEDVVARICKEIYHETSVQQSVR